MTDATVRTHRRARRTRLYGASFWAGVLIALVAVSPPLHALADETFAAHMVQHLLLILVAAPLIAAGRPLGALLELLPRPTRRRAGAAMGRVFAQAGWRRVWRWVTAPLMTWTLHTVAIWLWHAPPLFQGALASDTLHAAEHASFLATGVLYWWALLRDGTHQRHGYAVAILSVFAMAMQSGALGALLTFSNVPWYPDYAAGEARWGLSPLDDQQLAGLIMWVPAGLVYTGGALAMLGLWLQRQPDASLPVAPMQPMAPMQPVAPLSQPMDGTAGEGTSLICD